MPNIASGGPDRYRRRSGSALSALGPIFSGTVTHPLWCRSIRPLEYSLSPSPLTNPHDVPGYKWRMRATRARAIRINANAEIFTHISPSATIRYFHRPSSCRMAHEAEATLPSVAPVPLSPSFTNIGLASYRHSTVIQELYNESGPLRIPSGVPLAPPMKAYLSPSSSPSSNP